MAETIKTTTDENLYDFEKVIQVVKDPDNCWQELDKLIIKWLMIAKDYDNTPCKKCGVVQGILNFGVEKYYCEHVTKLVDNKLKKEKKEITKKIFLFTTCQDNQKNL